MSGKEHLRKNMDRLSRLRGSLESSLKQVEQTTQGKKAGRRNINLATRVNKAEAINAGEPNSVKGATSKQHVKITQGPGGTEEVIETHDVQISQ